MAREILFKAKRIGNGEWVEGFVSRPFSRNTEGNITNYCFNALDEIGFVSECIVSAETICQYTGLTDKNGNKIWENDVVKCVDVNAEAEFFAVVEFGNPNGFYSWGYQLKHIWGDEPNLDILLWIDMEEAGAYCEVIGNTFDNPGLMNTTGTIGYADNGGLMSAT